MKKSIFEINEDFYNKPIFLSKDDCKDPVAVMKDFFNTFELWENRESIANWLHCALTADHSRFFEPSQRKNTAYYAERLEELLEAVYLLLAKNSNKHQ